MNFNIQLTADQISYIGMCLGEKPYSEVVALVAAIQRQVDEQSAASQNEQKSSSVETQGQT